MTESSLPRAFIAIPLPATVQQQISTLQQQIRPLLPELKCVKTENLHLTLHFLGDQSKELLAKIGQNMLSIGQKKKNFNVTAKGLGFFPDRRRPKILWLGVEPEDKLIDLYRQLADGLRSQGLNCEQRTFRPHLTIGRFRSVPQATEQLCPFLSQSCGNFMIDKMILFSSRLTPEGAIHTPLTEAPLLAS